MKIKALFALLLTGISMASCSHEESKPHSLTMRWIIDPNPTSNGESLNTIEIINDGTLPLDSSWTLYFCAFPKRYKLDENAPVKIERISGTYYKITPTPFFKFLNANDTLSIPWKTTSNHATRSFAPTRAYLVSKEKNVEKKPVDVTVSILRKDFYGSNQLKDGTKIQPASILFEENKNFTRPASVSELDIIPSVKKISTDSSRKNILFTDAVTIDADSSFQNEATILNEELTDLLGCSVTSEGKTRIRLCKNKTGNAFQHSGEYRMKISEDGIEISADEATGIFYGTRTLLSILSDKELPLSLPVATLSDYPDLPYRGVMLDVSRNFTNKQQLLELIDLLAMYKMNAFHLHLSDDEGWRIEIPGLEELCEVGSRRGHTTDERYNLQPAYFGYWNPQDSTGSGNGYYTREDFIEILNYAKDRHISVIPEIDLPGHARAAIVAMKARYEKYKNTDMQRATEYLLSEEQDTSAYVSVQGYDDNVINVALPSTYRFVNKVIQELAEMYREADLNMNVMHIGGDEVPTGAWEGSPACKKLMADENMKEARDLKDFFVEKVMQDSRNGQIRIAGWQEIALKPHSTEVDSRFLNDNPLNYCWNTIPYKGWDEVPYKLANEGYDVILSNASNFYFDFAYSNNYYEPGHNWGGYVDEISAYDAQPYELYQSIRRDGKGDRKDPGQTGTKTKLKDSGKKHIIGVQGQLWSETLGNFDMTSYYLFPKMFGLSERGWNSTPQWTSDPTGPSYLQSSNHFNSVVQQKELIKLDRRGINFRIPEPGMLLSDGMVLMNCRNADATIRYTTDGSEPTENSDQWTQPIAATGKIIKAKSFYLGKESVPSVLIQD